jgi:hypothetical protein
MIFKPFPRFVGPISAIATSPQALLYGTATKMEPVPLEVWTAFLAIAAGGLLLLAGYVINYILDKWRK